MNVDTKSMGVYRSSLTLYALYAAQYPACYVSRRAMSSSPSASEVKSSVLQFLNNECIKKQNPKHAQQIMERYMKNIYPFYGIKSPELRLMIKQVQVQYKSQWTSKILLAASNIRGIVK